MNNETILIGCDPEVFIIDHKTGNPYPIVGIIGGTKENPLPISDKGHFIQEDNVMAEFNVPVALNFEQLIKDIAFCLNGIQEKIGENFEVSIVPSLHFDNKHLQSKQAAMFGCDPDFNVWLKEVNDPPEPSGTLRTAGGHIHIGYNEPEMETSEEIIKMMDIMLGVPSVLLDTDTVRKEMYGKAGAFRFKDYGVEYRVLSNFWITTEEFITWAYLNSVEAARRVLSGDKVDAIDAEDIVKCINNNDQELAKELIEKYEVHMP